MCARLTFAVSFGSVQAATVLSLIPGRRERKDETAKNNEAWDQLAQQEYGFSLNDTAPWLCPSDPCDGSLLDELDHKKVKDGNNKSRSVPGPILLASPSVYAKAKIWFILNSVRSLEKQQVGRTLQEGNTAFTG